MVFSSVIFLFYFLPVLLVVYRLFSDNRYKNLVLFTASLVFYAWAAGMLFLLLPAVALFAWLSARLMRSVRHPGAILVFSVSVFVLVLVFYKYLIPLATMVFPFSPDSGNGLVLTMPVGLSFITFQAVSFVVDAYRRPDRSERNLFRVMLYTAMFPQLISGPLVRYHSISAAFTSRVCSRHDLASGARRFITGLAKKVLIANPLGLLVGDIMQTCPDQLGPGIAWTGAVAFALQLFFDFSGYTDMAIGLGRMLGFNLPENFNHPYVARSVTDFWRRWHISLSGWLRDYLFMPLSLRFRRMGKPGVFFALMITFTLCGMWHGAGWNFVIWGAVHGFFLGMEQWFLGRWLERLRGFSVIYLLMVVISTFVLIASPDIHHAAGYLQAMFSPFHGPGPGTEAFLTNQYTFILLIAALLCIPFPYRRFFRHFPPATTTFAANLMLTALFLLSLMAVATGTYNPFLYFQF